MIRRTSTYIIVILFITTGLHTRASIAGKINVFVSIAPQKYFAEAIGDDLIQATVVVNPTRSPADYEPAPNQMVQMAKADIYFAVGVPFENTWLGKFSEINPHMQIIHTDAGIEKRPIDRHDDIRLSGVKHEDHLHHHGTADPHIWLSPPLVKIQAEHIVNALVSVDPSHQDQYRQNYSLFLSRLDELDRELRSLFSDHTLLKQFLVFHPSWGYFADAYGLTQISIEIEGKSPKAREVADLIDFARKQDIRLILVQPQFSTRQAEIIAHEINGHLIYADPLAEDWFNNIHKVATAIKQSLN